MTSCIDIQVILCTKGIFRCLKLIGEACGHGHYCSLYILVSLDLVIKGHNNTNLI